jgi:hypothetical protein
MHPGQEFLLVEQDSDLEKLRIEWPSARVYPAIPAGRFPPNDLYFFHHCLAHAALASGHSDLTATPIQGSANVEPANRWLTVGHALHSSQYAKPFSSVMLSVAQPAETLALFRQ